MCYAYKYVRNPSGNYSKVAHREFKRLEAEGKIKPGTDDYFFAKDTVAVILAGNIGAAMRWDLIPSFYLQSDNLTIAEVIKRKNSRAKNPVTGKSWGFSSYNARVESVRTLPSFRGPWEKGQRCIIAVDAFRERPNMDEAPKEFKGKEYEINLQQTMYFAGLWDSWKSKDGEALDSCTVVTASGLEIEPLKNIWHERVPVLLDEDDAEIWIDPRTTSEQAFGMCLPILGEELMVQELSRKKLDLGF